MADLTYAIGDVHGMHSMLIRALEAVRDHADGRSRDVVLLGDYIDRGPRSRDVVDLLREGSRDPLERLIPLRGNHEAMMISAIARWDHRATLWFANGGKTTLANYPSLTTEGSWDRAALTEDARFLLTLPLMHLDDRRIFVHAGLRPGVGLDDQRGEDLMWIRGDFLGSNHDFRAPVVHGHTPTISGLPEVRRNRVAVDTKAYRPRGRLSVAVFEEDPFPSEFLLVEHPRPDGSMAVRTAPAAEFVTTVPDTRF